MRWPLAQRAGATVFYALPRHIIRGRNVSGKLLEDPPTTRGYTVAELTKLLRVGQWKILMWIRNGELSALNVAASGKPRFVILPRDLEAFQERRRVPTPAAKPARRRRRTVGQIDFYPD